MTPIKKLISSPGTPTVAGKITVPSGEEVSIDGQSIPSGPIDTVDLTNGTHTITIKANGRTITKTINVQNALNPIQDFRNEVLAAYHGNKAVAVALLGALAAVVIASIFVLRRLWILRRQKPLK